MTGYSKKLFYINSRNRESGTDSDFGYELDFKAFNPTHCVVLQANIPKSFYVCRAGYNTFQITEANISGNTTTTVTVPAGTYTRQSFMSTLQSQLTLSSAYNYTYTMSIPTIASASDTGKYSFTMSGNSGYQSTIITAARPNNMFELLGFNESSSNTFVANTLTSANVNKLFSEDSIFIHSDLVGGITNNILQEIYSVNSADFSNIVFQNFAIEQYEKEIVGIGCNNYRFYLMNEDNETIDLNGLNWSLTLCCYKKDNTNELLQQYIKHTMTS